MTRRVVADVTKLVADPSKVTNAVGIPLVNATGRVCKTMKAAGFNQQGFAIAQKLIDPRVPDTNTRRAAIGLLVECDPANAPQALRVLANDKDPFVADGAKRILNELASTSQK